MKSFVCPKNKHFHQFVFIVAGDKASSIWHHRNYISRITLLFTAMLVDTGHDQGCSRAANDPVEESYDSDDLLFKRPMVLRRNRGTRLTRNHVV